MADTIVEFINTTDRTYEHLVAGVTIASNTANEQAVVKDVVLANPNSRNLRLTVGSSVVAETAVSARLTGSELLGASNILSLTTGQRALLNRIRDFSSTSGGNDYSLRTLFSEAPATSLASSGVSISAGTAFSTDPYFTVFADNGDFYYSNNSSSALFRRAGGVTGAQTQITDRGHSCSFDGRYIYSFNTSNQLAVTDTQNNGSVVLRNYTSSGFNALSSTSATAAIDGYVWVHPSWGETCFLLNPNTGTSVSLGGQPDGSSQRWFVGIGKNSSGDYIAVQFTSYSANVYWWNFGPSLAAPFIKGSGGWAQSGMGNLSNSNVNNLSRLPGSDRYLLNIAGGGQANTIFDLDLVPSNSGATNFTFVGGQPSQTSGKSLSITASAANTDFGLVNVRAAGIKTTP